jgi:predicted nucleic acid-binding protein
MGNRKDADHERCTNLLTGTEESLLLPEPLLVEIGYMLWRGAGPQAEADFLRDVGDGVYELVSLTPVEVRRAGELVSRYKDLPLGTADASVVVTAE